MEKKVVIGVLIAVVLISSMIVVFAPIQPEVTTSPPVPIEKPTPMPTPQITPTPPITPTETPKAQETPTPTKIPTPKPKPTNPQTPTPTITPTPTPQTETIKQIPFGESVKVNSPYRGASQELKVLDSSVTEGRWLNVSIQITAVASNSETTTKYSSSDFKAVGKKGIVYKANNIPFYDEMLVGTSITKNIYFGVNTDDSDFIFLWQPLTKEQYFFALS